MTIAMLVLGVLVAVIFGSIMRGWVLHILWGWFAVGSFNLAPIGITEAMGLSLIVYMFTGHLAEKKVAEGAGLLTTIGHMIGVLILGPMLALLMGWILFQIAY